MPKRMYSNNNISLRPIIYAIFCGVFSLFILLAQTMGAENWNSNYRSFKDVEALKVYFRWKPDRQPLISAHRGGPEKGFPENSLETFENTMNYGPCLIECDVKVSRDGELVMMHDDSLDRTTSGNGPVESLNLAQLKKLYLKDPENNETPFRIPTLGETLEWARNKAVLCLDVKRTTPYEKVIATVRKHRAESYVILITYGIDSFKRIHKMAPDLLMSVSVTGMEGVKHLLASGVPFSNMLVFGGVSEPEPELYKSLHDKGIYVCIGTMHNLDNKAKKHGLRIYKQLYENGADILSTDFVPAVSRAIKDLLE